MHDRCSQETRNKQTRKPAPTKGDRPAALLPQDPTVCQTLPNNPNQHAFQDTALHKEETISVLANRPVPPGTYSLIFHP